MRRNPTLPLVAAALLLGLGTVAPAGEPQGPDAPHIQTYRLNPDLNKEARLVYPTRRHPEVAVSRSLAAQPVHPWMAKIVLNNAMSTYIDPQRHLSGGKDLHLDENHSLIKAQRLHNSLSGMTTSQLNRLENQRRAAQPATAGGNHARVVHPNRPERPRTGRQSMHQPNRARVVRPNQARTVQPNRNRRNARPQPRRIEPAKPRPDRNNTAPAAEPAPQPKENRKPMPIPSVPRMEEQPGDRIAAGSDKP